MRKRTENTAYQDDEIEIPSWAQESYQEIKTAVEVDACQDDVGNETFEGWESPFFTSIPSSLFDRWMARLSGAELKVLLYIMRHTYGWHKDNDAISLSQMTDGIVRIGGGPRLDWGTGLSKKAVWTATKSLEARGLIITEHRKSVDRGYESTVYKLKMR